ncbi:homeodomain-containing transcription factor fwa [Arabis alpina]|uniref:Homeodomain-containing transcription factor fwa n=1 Tax=Arabis alpina TaxID=50452 RepID=A0A087GGQ1_ARAAL|nr:homeodomain-containing transcription factor fwa [Arabis alpina]
MSDGESDYEIFNSSFISEDDEQVGPRIQRYHRHTTQQIQLLEIFFKECTPFPDENQRSELGQMVNLDAQQVKFWFQNRRTQERMNLRRRENVTLRREHVRLLGEHEKLRQERLLSLCNICRMPTNYCEVSNEEQQLTIENARLKQEIGQIFSLICKDFQLPAGLSAAQPSSSLMSSNAPRELDSGGRNSMMNQNSMLLDIANAAMNELVMLGKIYCPFWRLNSGSTRETLDYIEYESVFNNSIKPPGFVIESSRDTGLVLMTSLDLVTTLMDMNKWVDVFGPIVSDATSRKLISTSPGGTRNGSLQMIEAEFLVPSLLVPKRQVTFLRYCKLLREGVWAVVDVTPTQLNPNLLSYGGSTRLPSGLIIEEIANDYCMVTWIELTAYDETHIHQMYRPLIGGGIGLGARRWLKTLQRHCQILSSMWTVNLTQDFSEMPAKVRAEIVKLAQRMTLNYYLGISNSSASKWKSIQVENEEQNMRLMIRKNMNEPGELTGIVLSAATSVWFPVNHQQMFDFLTNQNFRGQWDILTHNSSMEEKIRIHIANRHGNYVSLLKIVENDMLVLQEIWNDASGAMVVYAPVETHSMEKVINGADSDFMQFLSSGFSILPDKEAELDKGEDNGSGGCLLTLGLQVWVSSKPTTELTQSLVRTVEGLLDCTIGNIISGLLRAT